MRLIPLANCEKEFIRQGFCANLRADGRALDDFRPVTLQFGRDYGRCVVSFGNTKVFACTSCSLVTPKAGQPSRGIFDINLELSPMASSDYEGGRPESWVEMQRLLERNLRDSQCVDVESLCVIGGEKVWQIRCDLHVLDNDGSVLDCASFAAVAALRHFRRPFVSIKGLNYTIHDAKDRSFVPITVFSSPFCVSIGLDKQQNLLVVNDLTEREEMAISDIVVVGMNSYREIVLLHMCKSALLDETELFRCQGRVVSRVVTLTDMLNDALRQDAIQRTANVDISFADLIQGDISHGYDDVLQKTLTKKAAIRQPTTPKVKAVTKAKATTPTGQTRVSKKTTTVISDFEIAKEVMTQQPAADNTAIVVKPPKKRQTLPDDVAMMLDEIEEDVEVIDDPSLLKRQCGGK